MCSKFVIHNKTSNLESLSHKISTALGVKLSKAKEHHAKALGCKSYNSLISAVRSGEEVSVDFDMYLVRLEDSYSRVHKRLLSDDVKNALRSLLTLSIDDVFRTASFFDFMRYALIENQFPTPLLSWEHITESLHNNVSTGDDYDKVDLEGGNLVELANESLVDFLLTGNLSETLKSSIDKSFKYLKTVAKREVCEYWNVASPRFVKLKLLQSYKNDVELHKNPVIYHGYLLPLIEYFDSPYMACIDASFDKRRFADSLADSGINLNVLKWGVEFTPIQELLNVRKYNLEYYDGSEYGRVYYNSPVGSLPSSSILNRVLIDEDVFKGFALPKDSLAYSPYHLKFGINNDQDLDIALSEVLQSTGDSFLDDSCKVQSDLFALPLISKVLLSEGELNAISSSLVESMGFHNPESFTVGNFTPYNLNGEVNLVKFFGKAVRSHVSKSTNHFAAIYNTEERFICTIDSKRICYPKGRDEMQMLNDLCIDFMSDFYYEDNCFSHTTRAIADATGLKPLRAHTYINNAPNLDVKNPEADEFLYSHDLLMEETGFESKAVIVDDIADIVSQVPFNKCRNVYAISCDRGDLDDPMVIAGFDKDGVQALNITVFISEPSYHDSFWRTQGRLLGAIKKAITGYVDHFSLELGYPFCYGRHMFEPNLSEYELAASHVNLTSIEVNNRGIGASNLSEVWVKAPKGTTVPELDKLLRKELSSSEASVNSTASYHSNVIVCNELLAPPFFSPIEGDYSWFAGFSLNVPNVLTKPISIVSIPKHDISIYQQVTDNFLIHQKSLTSLVNSYLSNKGDAVLRNLNYMYEGAITSVVAMEGTVESLVDVPEELPNGCIRINAIADALRTLDFSEVLSFAKQIAD